MTDQLSIYNGAQRVLKERPLVSLAEASKARRVYDADYAKCLAWCAEQAQWRHALRVQKLNVASVVDVAPVGWTYAYDLPSDFARHYACSPDGNFQDPYNAFEIRHGVMYCELPAIWIKYISSTYGVELARFSATYVEFVETALAARNGGSITNDASLMEKLEKMGLKKALSKAKAVDVMSLATTRLPMGTWARSRNGSMTGEGGNGGGGGNGFYSFGPDFAAYIATLPTTPPATPGLPWNNGGVLSIS